MSEQQQEQLSSTIDAKKPSNEDKQLVALFNEMENKQPDFIDGAGKSIIERISTFLAVLFTVTAFGNTFPPAYLKGNVVAKVLVMATLVLYLAAMGLGILSIQPRYYNRHENNISEMRKELEKIISYKMNRLRGAGILFAAGSIMLAALIISIILKFP